MKKVLLTAIAALALVASAASAQATVKVTSSDLQVYNGPTTNLTGPFAKSYQVSASMTAAQAEAACEKAAAHYRSKGYVSYCLTRFDPTDSIVNGVDIGAPGTPAAVISEARDMDLTK